MVDLNKMKDSVTDKVEDVAEKVVHSRSGAKNWKMQLMLAVKRQQVLSKALKKKLAASLIRKSRVWLRMLVADPINLPAGSYNLPTFRKN